jgi:hypothetical protein
VTSTKSLWRFKQVATADSMRSVDFTTLRAIWNAWSKVWGIVGPVGNGAQWLYNVNARFHLGIRRVWYWLSTRKTRRCPWKDAQFKSSDNIRHVTFLESENGRITFNQ